MTHLLRTALLAAALAVLAPPPQADAARLRNQRGSRVQKRSKASAIRSSKKLTPSHLIRNRMSSGRWAHVFTADKLREQPTEGRLQLAVASMRAATTRPTELTTVHGEQPSRSPGDAKMYADALFDHFSSNRQRTHQFGDVTIEIEVFQYLSAAGSDAPAIAGPRHLTLHQPGKSPVSVTYFANSPNVERIEVDGQVLSFVPSGRAIERE